MVKVKLKVVSVDRQLEVMALGTAKTIRFTMHACMDGITLINGKWGTSN